MSKPKTLTEPMINMLRSACVLGDPYYHLRGQSEHGGAHFTMYALQKRGLFDADGKITQAGKNAFHAYDRSIGEQ